MSPDVPKDFNHAEEKHSLGHSLLHQAEISFQGDKEGEDSTFLIPWVFAAPSKL